MDEVWKSQPPQEINPVVIHPLEYAGRSVADKLKDLRKKLVQVKAHSIIISALDEVSWFGLFPYIFAHSWYCAVRTSLNLGRYGNSILILS